MQKTIATLTPQEFTEIIEHTIDKRLEVWLTQVLDALMESTEEREADFRPEFAASLTRAQQQAEAGETIDLETFRKQRLQ